MGKIFCPNCGSKDIEPKHEDIWGFRKNTSTWECQNCGYSGFMPEGDPENYSFNGEDKKPEEGELDQYEAEIPILHLIWVAALITALIYIVHVAKGHPL